MSPNQQRPLVWLDLEMTGLDAEKDVILEIAVLASDFEGNDIIEGPDIVIYHPAEKLTTMSEWVYNLHTSSDLLAQVSDSTVSVADAEKEILTFINRECSSEIYFAGNSIYQDRSFLKKYMPLLNARGHYRMVDVSTLKILVQGWYPNSPETHFKKSKKHRAIDDIRESVAEMQHYRKYFFK